MTVVPASLHLVPSPPDEHHWLRRALPDRYALVRALGRGSTGAVFLAHDRVLQRVLRLLAVPVETRSQRVNEL